MEWKAISPEEVKNLQFASRTGKENPYGEVFKAVEKGPVRIDTTPDKIQSLKWALSRAIKKAGIKITVATLADKTGVVLTKEANEQPKK